MDTILKKVAVIVLNYINYSMTIECVNRIKESKIRIVIVDNCSPNNSFEILSDHYKQDKNISIIKSNQNGGYAYGNNEGIRWVKRHVQEIKYFAIINPDVIIDGKTLESLACFLSSHEDVAIVAPVVIESNKKTADSMGWNLWNKNEVIRSSGYFGSKKVSKKSEGDLFAELGHIVHYVDVVKGCCFLAKIAPIVQIGMLDEDTFMYGEEEILAYKIKRHHLKEAVLIDQYCYHNHETKDHKKYIVEIQKHIGQTYQSRRILLKKYYNARWFELLRYDLGVFLNVYMLTPIAFYIKKIVRWTL